MNRPGRKLRITGKGRCNLTNIVGITDFLAHFGKSGRFLHQAFSMFFNNDLISFFNDIDIPTVTERGGRVFPASERAEDVVDALVDWTKKQGVILRTDFPVKSIEVEQGRVNGVRSVAKGGVETADSVIITTGGASYPATGSTGDGYRMAEALGHTITPIRPALIPIKTGGDAASRLQGVSLRNIKVKVFINGKKKSEAFGEMLFTHFGLSGPVVLTLSGLMVDALRQKKKVSLSIDLKPALDEKTVDARLIREFKNQGKQKFLNVMKALFPKRLAPICAEQAGIDPEKEGHHVTSQERRRIRLWLKDFSFEVKGFRPLDEAIITAGGVLTKEVNPKNMESRVVENLFIAGELLDLDGDTGGYNLQAAFSTGWIAGRAAAMIR